MCTPRGQNLHVSKQAMDSHLKKIPRFLMHCLSHGMGKFISLGKKNLLKIFVVVDKHRPAVPLFVKFVSRFPIKWCSDGDLDVCGH